MGRRAPLAAAVALLSVICATSAQETPLVGAPYEGLSGVVGDVEIVTGDNATYVFNGTHRCVDCANYTLPSSCSNCTAAEFPAFNDTHYCFTCGNREHIETCDGPCARYVFNGTHSCIACSNYTDASTCGDCQEIHTLQTGEVGASPYDAPPGEYLCQPDILEKSDTCVAVAWNDSYVARPHPVIASRALARDGRRRVVDEGGHPITLPMKWFNGDRLAPLGPDEPDLEGSDRDYVLAFEMFAQMRNWAFFDAGMITNEIWDKLHAPLEDCGLETEAALNASFSWATGRQLGRVGILNMLRSPWWHGGDIADQTRHYIDAAQADFLCVVAPELATDAKYETWLYRNQCADIRAALNLAPGYSPPCWYGAYRRFYDDGGRDYPADYDFTIQQPWSQGGHWDEHAKRRGLGYTPVGHKTPPEVTNPNAATETRPLGDHTPTGDRGTTQRNDATTPTPTPTPPPPSVAGVPVTDALSTRYPSMPSRSAYALWRDATSADGAPAHANDDERMEYLKRACDDVKYAAETYALGGSCVVTASWTVEGFVEGAARGVFLIAEWMRRAFHSVELGDGPVFLDPGDVPSSTFAWSPDAA